MGEGKLLLSKIFQPHLFFEDVLKQKNKLQSELQAYINNFKMPYDSFTTYGQTIHHYQHQTTKMNSEISNQTKYLQELQLLLLPRLHILQKCFLNLEAIMVTQEMSIIDAIEELAFQMKTKSEVATSLLESWILAMKTLMQDFKSIFEKFHSLLS